MRRRASLALSVALLVAAVSGVVTWRWWHDRPPYGPEQLEARATLRPAGQGFLGRVSWTPPPRPPKGNSFRIVVLDKRSRLMPGFITATSPEPDAVSAGADDALDVAQKRYPWLEGAGARKINGSYVSSGSAVFVHSTDASPVTFEFVLDPARPGTPAAVTDLMVGLINVGPEGQVYWAQRLLH